MSSLWLTNSIVKEKYMKQIQKLKDEMKQMKDDCDAKIQKVKDECNVKKQKPKKTKGPKETEKPKETSPRSKSYSEYAKKVNEGSPLSFGGGKTAHRRYRNVEYHREGNGHHTIRRVHIVGGKGHKSVTTQMGKTRRVAKKALSKDEIEKICDRKFIPGLFDDCMTKPAK
jgi:hypothetical protein